ncbi:hypothetical protein [Longirhabdus pacifica]|nr:hypothetical protein [Longirhabdus pacifica]
MSKKKLNYYERAQKRHTEGETNKKAITWIASAFGFIVVLISILLILDI